MTTITRTRRAVRRHPAGTTAGVGGVLGGLLITYFNLDPQAAGAVCAAVGLAASAVSYTHLHGGLVGIFRDIVWGVPDDDDE